MFRLERKSQNKAFAQLVLAFALVAGFAHGSLAAETVQVSAIVGNPDSQQHEEPSGQPETQRPGWLSGGFIGRLIDQLFPPKISDTESKPYPPDASSTSDRPHSTDVSHTSEPGDGTESVPRVLLGPGKVPMAPAGRHKPGLVIFLAAAILLALTIVWMAIRNMYERKN